MYSKEKVDIISETKKALAIIYKKELTMEEQDTLMKETVQYWKEHVNEGFLQYRKSVSDSGAVLDWNDPRPGTAWFQDHTGKLYLDLLGGFGIYNIGRRHPKVISAVQSQLQKQALHSQELLDPLRAYTSRLLSLLMPYDSIRTLSHCFFTNSGTESVEAAIKMAFLATGRKVMLSTINAFHGKTLGSLSCTSKASFRSPFLGTMCPVLHVPFNDKESLRAIFESSRATGAELAGFIIEPIQGEGGIHVADHDYLKLARELCDQYGTVLIFDEIQSGMARTGQWWACCYSGVCPDIMTIGKALGGGVMPVGACLGTKQVWKKYIENPFLFTTTFGGNPLALSAVIATLNVIQEEGLVELASERGNQFLNHLHQLHTEFPMIIHEIRGVGLMIGIEFQTNEMGIYFTKTMFSHSVLMSGTLVNSKTIRIEPPLTITSTEIDDAVSLFRMVLMEMKN